MLIPENADKIGNFEVIQALWAKLGGDDFKRRSLYGGRDNYYRSSFWRAVREQILIRDKRTCRRCGEIAAQVHHLDYHFLGVDHFYPQILVSLCNKCHPLMEHGREAEALLRRIESRVGLLSPLPDPANPPPSESLLVCAERLLELRSSLEMIEHCWSNKVPRPEHGGLVLKLAHQAGSSTTARAAIEWLQSRSERPEIQHRELILAWHRLQRDCEKLIEDVLGPIKSASQILEEIYNGQATSCATQEVNSCSSDLGDLIFTPVGTCPICGGKILCGSANYACENFQRASDPCAFKLEQVKCGRRIDMAQFQKLLADGKTDLLDNFISRTGKPFSAYLLLESTGKVSFEFADREE